MKFYAQSGEDKAIWRCLKDVSDGFYVEVGALDGIYLSNTYAFDLLGWSGICIEPHPLFFKELVINRPQSKCLQVAVWDENLDSVDFHYTERGSWSRVGEKKMLRPGWKSQPYIDVCKVRTQTLNSILTEHGAPQEFELLSIDVDGHESHVLRGFDMDYWRPRFVIIEYWSEKSNRSMEGDEVVKIDGEVVHSSCPEALDEFFHGRFGYQSVWKWGKSGNMIYCRLKEDAKRVAKTWNAGIRRHEK